MISHDVFGKAAEAQSNALGMPELRVIIYPQPKGSPTIWKVPRRPGTW